MKKKRRILLEKGKEEEGEKTVVLYVVAIPVLFRTTLSYNTGLIVMTWVPERLEILLLSQWLSKR
jgi:hypothetical protein